MKQAIILAAGEGQRLRPFTVTRPKGMLEVAGKPVLHYVVEALAQNGIRRIVLVVGYKKEQIFDYMEDGERCGVDIMYVAQEAQLGTAHALLQAREVADESFLVLSGDNLIGADTIAGFAGAAPQAVLVKRVSNPSSYGVVELRGKEVKGIVEKPREAGSNLVNTGIYNFSRDIFRFAEAQLDIPDALNAMLAEGVTIKAVETGGTWLDIVYPWDILGLNGAILSGIRASQGGTIEPGVSLKGEVVVGAGTVIRSGSYIQGPVVIGGGCDIGPNVSILPSTSIGDNVVIASFTEVRNSVIGGDVSIGAGGIITDSVIGRGCLIKGRFTTGAGPSEVSIGGECPVAEVGAMLGENCELENSVVTRPGVIVGNYCQVKAARVLRGQLPDRSLVF